MKNLYFRILSKAVNHYTEKGYTFPFCFSSDPLSPSSWIIVTVHRFEGFSDPSDNAVLYILEHKNGLDKGIVIDAYGPENDNHITRFLSDVPRKFPMQLIHTEAQRPSPHV